MSALGTTSGRLPENYNWGCHAPIGKMSVACMCELVHPIKA